MSTKYGIRPCAIVIHENKVLIIRAKYGNTEFYLFPGGGLESFETMSECAVRETLEETGYSIEVKKLVYVNEYINAENGNDRSISPFFLAKLKDTKQVCKPINDNGKIKEILWVDLSKIKEFDLRPKSIRDSLQEDFKTNFVGI